MKHYQSKIVKGISVNEIRPKVEEELKKVGFGVLTEINIQKVMKEKLDKDYLPHIILGACSPVYADKILTVDPSISTLLPCNVTLRDLGDVNVEVSMMNIMEVMKVVDNEEEVSIGKEVQEKLTLVLQNLG